MVVKGLILRTPPPEQAIAIVFTLAATGTWWYGPRRLLRSVQRQGMSPWAGSGPRSLLRVLDNPNGGPNRENYKNIRKTTFFYVFFLSLCLFFLGFLLFFYRIFHKGRISKNTWQIFLTHQKILPLTIFSVWTPA